MRKMFFCCKKILLILNNQKMKNLQELSLNEMKTTEGGGIIEGIQTLTKSVSNGVEAVLDFGRGFVSGWKAAS